MHAVFENIKLPSRIDQRGKLIFAQYPDQIPFLVKRMYYLLDLDPNMPRGFHAHRQLEQMIVCLKGSCKMLLDDGRERKIVHLSSHDELTPIPPMIWHEMFGFSKDCVLLVLASDVYSESDYIRDYKEFKNIVRGNAG
jgi:dTDP-4-dehydrorhamnose 3,5-epimerase-like enzyme